MMTMTWDVLATYVVPVLLAAAAVTLFAAWVAWRTQRDHAGPDSAQHGSPGSGTAAVVRRPTEPRAHQILWGIRLAVLAWGAVLAAGAYRLNHNPWRVVMVLGCVLAFLGLWTWLTAAASRRATVTAHTGEEVGTETPQKIQAGEASNDLT